MQRLLRLVLWTLEDRRNLCDLSLTEVFKMFYGYTEIDIKVVFTLNGYDKGLRGHSKKNCKLRFNKDQGRSWPGGSGGPDPPRPRPGPLTGYVQIRRVFSGGGVPPSLSSELLTLPLLFASLSVTFSDAVWRRHRTKVSGEHREVRSKIQHEFREIGIFHCCNVGLLMSS